MIFSRTRAAAPAGPAGLVYARDDVLAAGKPTAP